MKQQMALGLAAILFIVGCKTLESETQRISWEQQKAYMKKVQDPRVFGLAIYDTPTGPQIRGGGRLHPERAETLEMLVEEPLRPLVYLSGRNSGEQWPVLLDFTSGATWLEFDLASQLRTRPVGETEARLVKMPGDDIPAVLSVVSSLRLGQMFIEHPLVYVRMATGSLGSMNRDVSEGPVQAVIGWDILKKFDQIQFLYSIKQVLLATTEEYVPHPERLAATLPLVKNVGLCAVRGRMNGQAGNILIDPAGDFEVAANVAVSSLQMGEGIVLSNPDTLPSPGGVRVGARLLEKYQVTVCPKVGVIHFETPTVLEEK